MLLALVWVLKSAAAPTAADDSFDKAMRTLIEVFHFFDRENHGYLTRKDVSLALEGAVYTSREASLSRTNSKASGDASPAGSRRPSFSRKESETVGEAGITKRFTEMDFSRDGKVTFPEFVLAVEGWAMVDVEE